MLEQLHFIAGLPRSGSTLIANLLKQNPIVHAESVSSLCSLIQNNHLNWTKIEANQEYPNWDAHTGVLRGILQGYYHNRPQPIIFDKDRYWVRNIGLLESLLQRKIKILICVRNPAEILTSFERIHRLNPLRPSRVELHLGNRSNIAERAMYFSGPDGPLGVAHRSIQDAVVEGYRDRMLFVDYNRFCNTPRSQMQRIYDFFELPSYQHDFENIEQHEIYNDQATGLHNLHKIKPRLERTVVNCVEYLGLDLYEQYNREIFWTAWI